MNNNVQLIGNLGQDVQVMNFNTGNKKATFSLATSESYKNKDGEYVSSTQWHNVIAWGKQADLISRTLAKGNKVAIQGSLIYRFYEDKNGVKQNVTEIVLSEFMKISDSKKSKSETLELAEAAPF